MRRRSPACKAGATAWESVRGQKKWWYDCDRIARKRCGNGGDDDDVVVVAVVVAVVVVVVVVVMIMMIMIMMICNPCVTFKPRAFFVFLGAQNVQYYSQIINILCSIILYYII